MPECIRAANFSPDGPLEGPYTCDVMTGNGVCGAKVLGELVIRGACLYDAPDIPPPSGYPEIEA